MYNSCECQQKVLFFYPPKLFPFVWYFWQEKEPEIILQADDKWKHNTNTLPSQNPNMGDSGVWFLSWETEAEEGVALPREQGHGWGAPEQPGLFPHVLPVSSATSGAYQHLAVGGWNGDIRDNLANYPPAGSSSLTCCELSLFGEMEGLGFNSTFQKLWNTAAGCYRSDEIRLFLRLAGTFSASLYAHTRKPGALVLQWARVI